MRGALLRRPLCSLKRGCRIKENQELEDKARIPMSYVGILAFYVNETAAFKAAAPFICHTMLNLLTL